MLFALLIVLRTEDGHSIFKPHFSEEEIKLGPEFNELSKQGASENNILRRVNIIAQKTKDLKQPNNHLQEEEEERDDEGCNTELLPDLGEEDDPLERKDEKDIEVILLVHKCTIWEVLR